MARGLACVAALVVFLVGVPAANIATGGAPDQLLPTQALDLSDPEAVWQALRWSYLDGHLVPWCAHTTAWIGWAIGVFLVLTDAARLLRAGTSALHRHLATRSPRGWVTSTVASALILFSASNALAQPASAAVVATADQRPQPPAPRSDAYHVPDDVHPDCPRHQAVLGDTYWSLAEHHLGDGSRYSEIDALNHDRIPNPSMLLPGAIVLLPHDATNLPRPAPEDARHVVVKPGETASSIAEREYGDADAWTTLWDLNRNRPQPDGRAWRDPDLLRPGWHLTITTEHMSDNDVSPVPPAASATSRQPATPTTIMPPSPSGTVVPQPHPGTTISTNTGAFVGIGFAALVTAALFTTRLWHRRHYRPGSGDRSDLVTAPIVRALRIAHDRVVNPQDKDGHPLYPTRHHHHVQEIAGRDQALVTADIVLPACGDTVLGVRERQAIAIDLASAHGLGLTGPGAAAAARAVLLALIADSHRRDTTVIVPTADFEDLINHHATQQTSARLRIVDDLNAALDAIDTESGPASTSRQVIIAKPTARADERLRTALARSTSGVAAVLLGPWPDGVTVHIHADGVVAQCAPERDDLSTGDRLFALPDTDTTALLNLFAEHSQALEGQPPRARPTAVDDVQAHAINSARNGGLGPVGARAESASAASSLKPAPPLSLSLFGPPALGWHSGQGHVDVTNTLARKHWQLLIFLALQPDGVTRDAIREALWPKAHGPKPFNAFYATLSQIRGNLGNATDHRATTVIELRGDRAALNPAVVAVDYWEFLDAQHSRTVAADKAARRMAWSRIAAAYRGELAQGVQELWLDAPREDAHRGAVDSLAALAQSYRDTDPQLHLQVLEHARMLDRYNEDIYRDIMRVQAQLGLADAIARTLALLTRTLAEIDSSPRMETVTVAETLRDKARSRA